MTQLHVYLFENQLGEDDEIVAPVGPLMAGATLVIGVAQAVLVEHLPELGIVPIEEVVLADADPI